MLNEAVVSRRIERGRAFLRRLVEAGPTKCQRMLGFASARVTPNPFIGVCGVHDSIPPTAVQMIVGYSQGLFPMDFRGRLRWHCPDPRFVLHLDELRLSPNMRRDIRKANFTHTFDRDPKAVLDGCADRPLGTWLSPRLKALYLELFELGAMHSIETWRDGALVGGSFGIAIGRMFSGETMFHRVPDAGKSSFVHLASHLRQRGFVAIDAQSRSEHMVRFGAREIPLADYRKMLALGLLRSVQFRDTSTDAASTAVLEAAAQHASVPQNGPKSDTSPKGSRDEPAASQAEASLGNIALSELSEAPSRKAAPAGP